nr:hypothetical protein [Tanacetum cinerariifolium]
MPLISVSFQAIAFFRVLRMLMRSVFSFELRSFAMITGHFSLSPRNAYSRLVKSRWTCLTRNILMILNEITDCCGLKLLDVIMKYRIIIPSSGEWTLIIAMI